MNWRHSNMAKRKATKKAVTEISVKAADIKNGDSRTNSCPIALAVKRQFGKLSGFADSSVDVDGSTVSFMRQFERPHEGDYDFGNPVSIRKYADELAGYLEQVEALDAEGIDYEWADWDECLNVYYSAPLPIEAAQFVEDFDNGEKVKPFTFKAQL